MRGAFILSNARELPNNLTNDGAYEILIRAMQNTSVITNLWMALVDAVFDPTMDMTDIDEPTLGVGGYARQALTRDGAGWPGAGYLNGVPYIESKTVTFPATAAYSRTVSRLALVSDSTLLTGPLFCLGSVFPTPILFDSSYSSTDRSFKYRLYAR